MRGVQRGLLPSTTPTSKHWTPAGALDILPNGRKAKGVSLFDRGWVDYSVGPNANNPVTHLADFWSQWEWSNPSAGLGGSGNWIKPQIDMAVDTYGCNYIRFFATSYGRNPASGYASLLDDATYFGRWKQVLDYCRSRGIYCYPTLELDSDDSSQQTWFGYKPTNAWRMPEWQHLARLFAAYLDVVMGIDLMNEGFAWASFTTDTSFNNPGATIMNGNIAVAAIKPILPSVPLSVSTFFFHAPNQSNPFSNNQDGAHLPLSGIALDHYDCHVYYDASPADFDVVLNYGKPLLIGEFGAPITVGTPARQSRYNAVAAVNSRASNAPSNPVLATATTGGTVAAGTYQVVLTYVTAAGETVGSNSQSIVATGTTSTITITSPHAITNATGWYAYVTQAGGNTYTRQQTAGSPTAIGTNLTLTAPPTNTGANPPVSDTSTLPTRGSAGAAPWSMWDSNNQDVLSSFQYGLADSSGGIRADVKTIFQGFPS